MELLTNLSELPVRGALFVFLPVKIAGSSAGPGDGASATGRVTKKIRDLSLLLPFLLTGGALVAYSTVMSLSSVYRVYAFVAFSPFLIAGIALLLLGPAVVAVVRRSERPVDWTPGRADGRQ